MGRLTDGLAERSSASHVGNGCVFLMECCAVDVLCSRRHTCQGKLSHRVHAHCSTGHVVNGCLFLMECCAVDVLCSWRHTCQRKLSHREHMQTPCAPPEYGRQISFLTLNCNLEICTCSISGVRAALVQRCARKSIV